MHIVDCNINKPYWCHEPAAVPYEEIASFLAMTEQNVFTMDHGLWSINYQSLPRV